MSERNKFLTEAMGYIYYTGLCGYNHPDKPYLEFTESINGINFSTWEGFGKLLNWCTDYGRKNDIPYLANPTMTLNYLSPDRFADAIYNYLKSKEV